MSSIQKTAALFALLFGSMEFILLLRETESVTGLVAFGTLTALALVLSVVDIEELAVNLKSGEVHVKSTATPYEVETTLLTDRQLELLDPNQDERIADTFRKWMEKVERTDPIVRTDADYLTLSTEAWSEKEYDNALRYGYAGLERPSSDKRVTAALYSRLAMTYADQGDPKHAERLFKQAVEVKPDSSSTNYNLGRLYLTENRLEEAEKFCRKAIELEPSYSMAYNNLGNVLSATDREDEAEENYRKAIELDPDNAVAYMNLGILLGKTGRMEEAEKAYRKSIEIDPDEPSTYGNLSLLLRKMDRTQDADEMSDYAEKLRENTVV